MKPYIVFFLGDDMTIGCYKITAETPDDAEEVVNEYYSAALALGEGGLRDLIDRLHDPNDFDDLEQ